MAHHRAKTDIPSSGKSNPFGTSFDDDDEEGHDVPTAMLSQGGAPAEKAAPDKGSNPFDFDVDFSQVQKRRERARQAKESQKEEAAKPIMSGMDMSDPVPTVLDPETAAAIAASRSGASGAAGAGVSKPIPLHQRAKTAGAETFSKNAVVNSLFGAFNQTRAEVVDPTFDNLVSTKDKSRSVQAGHKKLAVWPYDDYHVVQKLYYEKLAQPGDHKKGAGNKNGGNGNGNRIDMNTSFDSMGSGGGGGNNNGMNNGTVSQIPVLARPADPPDIPQAVINLPLSEFERVAEERSIAIVSTWLFDAGLIDELLVNGGMSLTASGVNASTDDGSVQTNPSQQGVEVGPMGYPIEGSKMDKEISKLRNSTKRQLALINARLNDGVAATGSEVQELVNAVITTKDDIGRLRELSTYVSNAGDVEQTNQFMLTKYPKLKQAINARRNLARCFRELDFFSQIPHTCERLREELHAGEWTAHEWSTLRNVCREHVELEMFLVEAEAGMKKRLEEEGGNNKKRGQQKDKFGRNSNSLQNKVVSGNENDDDLIDRFLSEQVENVWEMGDEIRLRIMSGIGTSFDLAMNNPAGMVALVEAVEAYETANEEYKTVHGEEAGRSQNLRFTDMRAAALGELYKDFEARGLDVFRELTMQAADTTGEEEASNQQFSAVLRAANELTSEIGVVKENMAPCFPPNWAIETLWTTCVSHVCSNNILQQIGGPEGHKLPDLSVTQLLDLVAWVENFREIIEETFPNIGTTSSKRTYFDKPPQLLVNNNKEVDLEAAKDSLAWVNNTLWNVHDLAKDEFLYRTKEQTEEWLDNVYQAEHMKNQTAEGLLVTSLCEDVFALAGVQLRTIRERLTRRSEALVQAVGVIFKNLYEKQMSARDDFCTDLEECCAAANDFVRMSEKCEEIVGEIQDECNLSPVATETLEEQSAVLLGLYSSDAVYAAQKTHIYCFEPIEEAVATELFKEEWLTDLTNNELALTLVRTLDDFMEDLETFLDEVMVQKCVEAQVAASVNFYIKCLLTRAAEHNSSRNSFFGDNEKAINRMKGDAAVIREHFEVIAEETMPTLARVIEREFSLLDTIFELLSIASGVSHSDAQDFILVLMKRVRNVDVTKFVIGDLYHLVKPAEEHVVYELIDSMEAEMSSMADEKALTVKDRNSVPGLRVDFMMAEHCAASERKRPVKAGTMDRAEAALRGWSSAFGGGGAAAADKD